MKAQRLETGTAAQEQAALWLTELEEAGPRKRAECVAWLKASPENVREFLFMVGMWDGLNGIDAGKRVDLEGLLREASAKVLPIGDQEAPLTLALSPRAGRGEKKRWIAAAALMVAAIGTAWMMTNRAPTYSTAVGEQRTVKLPDGSMVQMNTRSRISVSFDEHRRELRLLEGEAMFTAAHDAVRPFRVRAGDALIQALGTQFNIYRRPEGTTVSVVEGAVRVSTDGSDALAAGQQIDISSSGTLTRIANPDIAKATAWLQRQLIFRGEPLERVAAEVNRYNAPLQIRVEGKAARERRMIGVFAADDPDSLVQFLERAGDLSVERRGDEFLIRSR